MMNYENRPELVSSFKKVQPQNKSNNLRLAYKFDMYASLPLSRGFYIDAVTTGEVCCTMPSNTLEYSHGKQSNASTATNKVQFQQLWFG
jgi:hypothetical protein